MTASLSILIGVVVALPASLSMVEAILPLVMEEEEEAEDSSILPFPSASRRAGADVTAATLEVHDEVDAPTVPVAAAEGREDAGIGGRYPSSLICFSSFPTVVRPAGRFFFSLLVLLFLVRGPRLLVFLLALRLFLAAWIALEREPFRVKDFLLWWGSVELVAVNEEWEEGTAGG